MIGRENKNKMYTNRENFKINNNVINHTINYTIWKSLITIQSHDIEFQTVFSFSKKINYSLLVPDL